MESQRTGILGGTFNPIHNQHLLLAKAAYEQLSLDKVLLIPSGISYLKEGTGVLPADVRYEMCRLAVKDIGYLEISDIEIKRQGNSYTCDTIRELKAGFPDIKLYFIIGADTLFMLDKWKNPEYIFKNSIIAVASRLDGDSFTDDKIRDRIRELEGSFNADIKKIDIEASGLSSSMIRQAAERGEDISCFVPKDVAEYIKMNGLYR